ncbi:aldo/keto reductase [candidate division KSB3 bacterium]|uniref:Aldo/keto reductase n=1 Tax=candidate division KSB3 bacterium TaxID=2044937 RepID=A0A9D5Q7N0_9BACT|nr:aldo/keto reductase [candidate division KSB3 bacterium]MBD3327060.1 aldo/keto reductase [candidate division KSB3 bacterium]
MHYRTLGHTGMTVSVIGIGTWQFGGEWGKTFDPALVNEMFDACRQAGINLIDTAECYGDHTSEALIGQAIQRDRDHWIVATKFGHKFHGFLDRTTDYSAAGMVAQLEASLRALRTDWIDLYQVHGVSQETFEDDDLWTALDKQKQLGKIRAIGVSIKHDTMPLGRSQVETVQVIHNRLNRGAEDTVFPICQERGLGVLARVPLASGYLSGKYQPGQRWHKGDVRYRYGAEEIDQQLQEVARIQAEEVPDGVNMATWALSWCLRHPAVTAVIPGCKSVAQVQTNAAAADLDIQQETHPQASEAPEKLPG